MYFAGVFWLTRHINIPINEQMALWNPLAPPADWAALRDTWNVANAQRTGVAVLCFAVALMITALPGRALGRAAATRQTAA